MNKACKEYLSEIKLLFPIKSKEERAYIKKLASDIEAYCEDVEIVKKEDLYQSYGKPNDVVNGYFSSVDTEYITKRIKSAKYIKAAVAALIILATVTTSLLCIYMYGQHKILARQEVIICNEIITGNN